MDLSHIFSLDLETSANSADMAAYAALQPFRYKQGKARVTSVAIACPDNVVQIHERQYDCGIIRPENMLDELKHLERMYVVGHNMVFDVSWLYEYVGLEPLKNIFWLDTQLLDKWLNNSQKMEFNKKDNEDDDDIGNGRRLVDIVQRHIPNHPFAEEFIKMKGEAPNPGVNYDYWLKRGKQDAILTREAFIEMWRKLPEEQRKGYLIECSCILPVARSWMQGIKFDNSFAESLRPRITEAKSNIAKSIGVDQKTITSSKKLSEYLFGNLGLAPVGVTSKGAPSTAKDNLMFLHYNLVQSGDTANAQIVKNIQDFKQLNTLESKYLDGFDRVINHVGEAKCFCAPRLFGTYTGRFTYSSKTRKIQQYQIGIAMHQIPRKGPVRKMLTAPEGYVIAEFDASGQESRLMALESQDVNMLDVFANKGDLHSVTGSRISGIGYNEFMDKFHNKDPYVVNMRYNGKFVNLSCNYRIGDAALTKKAFVQYGIVINEMTGKLWNNTFKTSYRGVPEFWKKAIRSGKIAGYATTMGKRRYYLSDWNSMKWATESSAINTPIQGAGADMKCLAISEMFRQFPEAIFNLDLHDGLWTLLPEEHASELAFDIRNCLNNLDYESAWDYSPNIPLLWDASFGTSFGDQQEIDWKSMYTKK